MASLLSTVNFNSSLKRSYSDAFDEEDFHQQQKWHISEKEVATSNTTGLKQVWDKTLDRLINGGKNFWNSAQLEASATPNPMQAQSNTEFDVSSAITHHSVEKNFAQRSIKSYFNSQVSQINSLATPMDTTDSPPSCPLSDPCNSVAESSNLLRANGVASNRALCFTFGSASAVPTSSKPNTHLKVFGGDAIHNGNAGAGFGRAGVVPSSMSSLRQLTLNKCGRFAGSFVPRGLPDVAQPTLPPCSDCQATSQQPSYLIGASLKCYDCDRPHCSSCLKACYKCEHPFCALCRMNSFQHRDSNKTVCIRCIS